MTPLQASKKSKSNGRFFIPPFYDLEIGYFGKENYKVIGGMLFVTPMIRTILHNFRDMSHECGESVAKRIREKVNPNARLLVKKGTQSTIETSIGNKRYVPVKVSFKVINDTTLRLVNSRN